MSFQLGVLVGVIIAFGLAAFAVKNSNLFYQKHPKSDPMLTEGFNFRKLRIANNSWSGPNLGERINLSQLKNSDGKPLADAVTTSIFMVVTLDPECAVCNVSGDLMNLVREGIKPIGIEYYPISFARFDDLDKIDQYSSSLGFPSKAFAWSKEGELPKESLQNMITPSHLLLDKTGLVLQVWAGSSREKVDRERMSQQIIADTIIINDTLAVLEQK